MRKLTPFHVAVPVYDLEEARKFYREVVGCGEGRSDVNWTDFDLYGHQFVIHLKPRPTEEVTSLSFSPDTVETELDRYFALLDE
jgi:extradiol dioxygenase family protein